MKKAKRRLIICVHKTEAKSLVQTRIYKMNGNFHHKQKGFTLIELMIVIAIVGILAAIAIPQFNLYRVKGFKATTRSDVKNAHTAVQAWYADNRTGTPPETDTTGPAQLVNYTAAFVSSGVRIVVDSSGNVTGTYVPVLNGSYIILSDGSVVDTLSQ